jgi:[protein-PII] uridylyltransferase
VRVSVAAGPGERQWTIDVACRDTDALLARLTGVLTEFGLDIVGAKVATWPDGAVLDSFVVEAIDRPPAKSLALAMQQAMTDRLSFPAVPGLTVDFDNDSLPWHTAVTVTGADQPGLLQAVSTAFAATEMVVHTARVATTDGIANDRFAVTDRIGRKVTAEQIERMTAALVKGGRPRRSLVRR